MHVGFRRPHVGPLIDQLARQADRQIGRQLQMGQIELLADLVGRILPGQRRQEVALLRQLLLKRRQQLLGLRQCRVLRQHVGLRRLTEVELPFQNIQQMALDRDDALGGVDLAAQRGFLDRRRHHIAGQRQVGGLELEQLLLGGGVQALDGAEVAAPDIRHERHRELVGHQREFGLRPLGRNRRHLAGIGNRSSWRRVAGDLREEQAALGERVVAGDLDRGFRGLQVGIVVDRLPDQFVSNGDLNAAHQRVDTSAPVTKC